MSLSIEPKKGIRLKLDNHSPIRSWQGGGQFWENDFQLTIRQGKLANYLPRATEEAGSVLYELMIDGHEALSESVPLGRLADAPATELAGLRAALAELKAKADDPLCDPTKKRIIEAFRLPDPIKDPELYRLHGKGPYGRLLVLWGAEKEAGSALVPLQALERGTPKTPATLAVRSGGRNWLWLVLLLLLLLLVALAAGSWYFRDRLPQVAGRSSHPIAQPGGIAPPTNGEMESQSAAATGAAPFLTAPASPTAPPAGTPVPAATAAATATPVVAGQPTPALASKTNGPVTDPSVGAPAVTSKDVTPAQPDTAPGKQAVGNASPTPTPARRASPSPSAKSRDSLPDELYSAPPGTLVHDDSTPLPSRPRTAPSATPRGTPYAAAHPSASPGAAASSLSGTGTDAKPFLPGDGAAPASGDGSATSAAAGSAPPTLEISSTAPTTSPRNGQVEVTLKVRARDAGGNPANTPKITEWRVDNAIQNGKDGKPFSGTEYPTTLTKGTHRVSVVSTLPDGRPVTSEADVNIDVKVTEQGSVEVQPVRR